MMEIIVEDVNSKSTKVEIEGNNDKILCEVYRSVGIGGNEYDYGEMEYEEDAYIEFEISQEECDFPLSDEIELEEYIQDLFYDEAFLKKIGYEIDEDEDIWKAPYAKKVLDEFYSKGWAKGSDCDIIDNLFTIANKMAEIIESKFDECELH